MNWVIIASPACVDSGMATNTYRFITHWRFRATCEEVSEILSDTDTLARWWPSVYLEVRELEPGDEKGIGKVVDLFTRGWLPYTLRWQFTVTESNKPHGFALEATGDFAGRGVWTFEQDGEYVDVTYDWQISANKTLLRYGSFIAKAFFARNHEWAMRKGERSLELELQRRRTAEPGELALIPPPPPVSSFSKGRAVGGAIGAAVVTLVGLRLLRRSTS